ncbi:pentraxin-related protein PTX3 [Pteropus alecto]|uniref:Pentraxin-related protein PTX3 n=1 Tax=Pteropus vampyrus TaxID=132908 RepID=A0A6P3RQB7_PTEVA|nr:pentraxin-related protein PTX3 [Pteropus alecto]XP_011377837.1 pentraxin-related protein PTX3 [Pteropus vampyrus]XP_039713817.1 pentraxin-related protein PTX3 [Pteropus giganteus]
MHLPAILLCVLWSAVHAENLDDYELMYVNLDNEIDNGLHPTEDPTPCDCRREHSEWDKLFIMLEDSQMREGMLLQATDDVLRGELRGLRGELGRLTGSLEKPCTFAAPAEAGVAQVLDELLQASRDAGQRLARLEAGSSLGAVLEELRRTRADLRAVQGWAARRWLPAGCETAILFPMRSKKIFGSVHPATPMKLESFSACIWVKATDVLNKTILFSYGTKRNPYEIQLYLSYQSIVLVVGGEENKLVADTVISLGRWTHLCSTWNSEKGRVSLWVNGELVATAVGMASDHIIPEGGILQIGQEKNGCCVGGGFDETLAFSGRLTGFNIWDRVLGNEEIREMEGAESCHIRGNVVGWGVTEIQPHGGAQYIS